MIPRILAALPLLAALALAQEETRSLRYTPASRSFACELPSLEWHAFEEEDAAATVVRILGPDNAAGTYRAGIDVRWFEKDEPGFLSIKDMIDKLRRSDKNLDRAATGVRPMRISGALARILEVTETRRLPEGAGISREEALHHYVAIVPNGENYHLVRLSSSRGNYLDYRDLFVKFLRAFRPLGAR